MKKLYSLFFLLLLLIAGCKDDPATGPVNNGLGGPGGGTNTVNFAVDVVQNEDQELYFQLKPSSSVVINSITINCAAVGVNNEQIQADGTTVFNQNEPAYVGPVNGLAAGQQWAFAISGKLGSSTGTAYSANASLVIP